MYLIGDGACITNIKGIARETSAVSAVGLYALATGVLGVNIALWCDYLGGGCSDNKLFNLYQSIVTWESECTFAGISPSTQIKVSQAYSSILSLFVIQTAVIVKKSSLRNPFSQQITNRPLYVG